MGQKGSCHCFPFYDQGDRSLEKGEAPIGVIQQVAERMRTCTQLLDSWANTLLKTQPQLQFIYWSKKRWNMAFVWGSRDKSGRFWQSRAWMLARFFTSRHRQLPHPWKNRIKTLQIYLKTLPLKIKISPPESCPLLTCIWDKREGLTWWASNSLSRTAVRPEDLRRGHLPTRIQVRGDSMWAGSWGYTPWGCSHLPKGSWVLADGRSGVLLLLSRSCLRKAEQWSFILLFTQH